MQKNRPHSVVKTLIGILLKYNVSIFRSLFFCFRVLPWRQAVRIPIFISGNTTSSGKLVRGGVRLKCKPRLGMVKIGFTQASFFPQKANPSLIDINGGTIVFDGYADIGAGCKISVANGGELHIGNHFWSTGPILLIVRKSVDIGDNCVCSWNVTVMDHDAHNIYKDGDCINPPKGVVIKDHCWFGFNSCVLKGVTLESDTVVSANAVVTKSSTEPNIVIAGVPARRINEHILW